MEHLEGDKTGARFITVPYGARWLVVENGKEIVNWQMPGNRQKEEGR